MDARALIDKAVALHTAGDYKAAVPYYVHAVRQAEIEAKDAGKPVDPDVLHAAGVALAVGGKRTEAVAFLEQAILNGKQHSAPCWSALGLAYVELRQLGKAERCYRQACHLDPASVANWTGYANLAACGGAHDIAEWRYDNALRCHPRDPEELMAQAMTKLRRGQWKQGWREYEIRAKTSMWAERNPAAADLLRAGVPQFTFWHKPNASDVVLVVAEQGQGDTVQFGRYVPELQRKIGCRVALQVPDVLVDMMQGAMPDIPVLKRGTTPDGMTGWCLLLSLPAILKASAMWQVPAPIRPFGLAWGKGTGAPSPSVTTPSGELPHLRVFVHSRGNAQHGYDFDRSAPGGVLEGKVQELGHEVVVAPFKDLGSGVMAEPTWRETVDVLLGCDAVVTVDTGLAHVAGSLGLPMLLCVPTIPEFRWGNPTGRTGTRTAWYPTAQIARRSRTERWDEIPVAAFLEGLCRE